MHTIDNLNFYILFLGAVIIFTAIFSKIFVRREISVRHWLGIFTIIMGLTTIGVSDLLSESSSKSNNDIIIGNKLLRFDIE